MGISTHTDRMAACCDENIRASGAEAEYIGVIVATYTRRKEEETSLWLTLVSSNAA